MKALMIQTKKRKLSIMLMAVALIVSFVGVQNLNTAPASADAINDTDFVITIDTRLATIGPTQFTIPTTGAGYNYTVDCDNDGTHEVTGQTGNYTCNFATPGRYTIRIGGTFPRIYFNNTGDRMKLASIDQWGTNQWASMAGAFHGTANMDLRATDTPNLTNVTTMYNMFANTSSLVAASANMNWDTSHVSIMSGVFANSPLFNRPIGSWNTANVTTMNSMFANASAFNQPLNNWNTANVTDLSFMFSGATNFNQPLNNWNTGRVAQIRNTFNNAIAFNQSLASWNVSAVTAAANGLSNSGMSRENYDATLIAWNAQSLQNTVTLGANGLTYCLATAARANMTASVASGGYGWTITGDTRNCPVSTVSFDSQSGSAVANQSVAYGDLITEPTAPTREGYTFAGWYTQPDFATQWNFTTNIMPANAMTLYARWIANPPVVPVVPSTGTPPSAPNTPAVGIGAGQSATVTQRLSDTGEALWLLSASGVLMVTAGVVIVRKLHR